MLASVHAICRTGIRAPHKYHSHQINILWLERALCPGGGGGGAAVRSLLSWPSSCHPTNTERLQECSLLQEVTSKGERLREGLRKALAGNAHVKEVRGLGLIVGIQLDTVPPPPSHPTPPLPSRMRPSLDFYYLRPSLGFPSKHSNPCRGSALSLFMHADCF